MDADPTEREQALEVRVAKLEARIARLEASATGGAPAAPPAATPTPAPAAAPIAAASGTSTGAVPGAPILGADGLPAWMAAGPLPGQVADPPLPPPTPASSTPAPFRPPPPSAWVQPEPLFRIPDSWRKQIPAFSGSLADIEERLAGRALAWIGGLALVLGAIFFLSLAFSRGWIGEEGRVVIGLVAGIVALVAGAAFIERGNRLLGHVLTPVGLAIISISLVAATRLYALVPVEVGLLGALVSSIAVAVIAVRANSQIVAAFGLIAVLVAPPLMGATPDLSTLLFVAVVLVGTTGVALWRSWSWLPPVAFLLAAPQVASWISSGPDVAFGLAGIALFWLLNAVAAGGEAVRRRRDDLSPSSTTLLLADAAFAIWAGTTLLTGAFEVYLGAFLVLLAVAHLALGGVLVRRDGERNLFGLLTLGTGIAVLSMAAPIQLGASAAPIAWTAEAVALAWLAVRRGHPYSAIASAVLFGLTGVALIIAFGRFGRAGPVDEGIALADGNVAALAFFAAGLAAGVWLARDRSLRSALSAFGLVVAWTCATQVLAAAPSTFASTFLFVLGTLTWRALPLLPSTPIPWQTEGLIPAALRRVSGWRAPADATLPFATALMVVAATGILIVGVYGIRATDLTALEAGVPFANLAGAVLAAYLLGLAAVAAIAGSSRLREPLAATGLLVIGWACLVEFDGVALVAVWVALMVGGVALWRGLQALPHDPPWQLDPARPWLTSDLSLPAAAGFVGFLAALHVVVLDLPIAEFGEVARPAVPFSDAGAAAALILVVGVLATGVLLRGGLARRVSILLAGGIVAYAAPFEVDWWAVTVLWVALAMVALALIRADPRGRTTFLLAATFLVGAAALVALDLVARPSRLVVGTVPLEPVVLLQSIAALGAVSIGILAIARSGHGESWARWAWLAGGISVVYLSSIAVVGIVETQVGGAVGTDELRTQGQVALSVLWAVLGLTAFVAGLRLRIPDLRHGGLALLALATAKVFLFDLSALDVAYRVISLIALGLLLLTSAWVWQRLQHGAVSPGGPVGD